MRRLAPTLSLLLCLVAVSAHAQVLAKKSRLLISESIHGPEKDKRDKWELNLFVLHLAEK